MQTRDQEYARKAYEHVTTLPGGWGETQRKRYGATAFQLPVLILQSGLAQALAFVASRGKEEQELLLDHLAESLDANDRAELLSWSREQEIGPYMVLTRKALLALGWYKRFAQSVLKVEAADDAGTP